jgi:hypothetical protein
MCGRLRPGIQVVNGVPGVQPAAVMHNTRPSQRTEIGSAIARSVRMMER